MNKKEILAQIALLENQISVLKAQLPNLSTVKVPEMMQPIFENAQNVVSDYFKNLKFNPEEGTIQIEDERYILVRASSLSHEFFKNFEQNFPNKTKTEVETVTKDFLFDIGHVIGLEDAKRFHFKMNLNDPISKMSAGPIHFAYAGWAFVDILPESNPSPDKNFFLKYHHPYSFEADSWIKSGEKTEDTVCIMNAAYSSGWCESSFGIPLTAVEISCRARGDENCTFIMAQPDQIERFIEQEQKSNQSTNKIDIPYFFERKKMQEELVKSEEMLKTAQKSSKLGSWEFDLETHDLIWSEELYNIYEIDPLTAENELYEKYLAKFLKKDLKILMDNIHLATTEGTSYEFKHSINLDKGLVKWIYCTGTPIKNKENKVVKLIGYAQDISDKTKTEKELNEFFRLSTDLLCVANVDGYFVKLSNGWVKKTGYSHKKLTTIPFINFFHEEDLDKTIRAFEKVKEGVHAVDFEHRFRCKNGKYINLTWNSAPDLNTGLVYCVARDVTQEREAEQNLMSTVREKEILLKEVHHRVKNNLQIISSLLNLQSGFINNEETIHLYRESQNRIKSIAAVHELLYQSNDLSKIPFDRYLKKLVDDLVISYHGTDHKIKLNLSTIEKFDIDTSIPLGLIINEIVTNSLKHGLKNETDDLIYVEIKKQADENFLMKIGDNGKGFHDFNQINKPETLGIMLIKELTDQLNGTIIKTNQTGSHFELTFDPN